jgi:Mor family transcriptional regulator
MIEGTPQYARALAKDQRNIEMLRDHLMDGATYSELASHYGLSVSYVGKTIRSMFYLQTASYRTPLPPDLILKIKSMNRK